MPTKMIYIRPEDEHVFKEASAVAKEEGESLSSVIVEALRRYMVRKNTPSEGLFAVVDLYDNSIEIFKGEDNRGGKQKKARPVSLAFLFA